MTAFQIISLVVVLLGVVGIIIGLAVTNHLRQKELQQILNAEWFRQKER